MEPETAFVPFRSDMPQIAICGLHIESSTFTPHMSGEADFEVLRGPALLARYNWMSSPWAQRVQWIPILRAAALPGGVVARDVYERWKSEIVAALAMQCGSEPLDGLYFDVHGAMSVEGLEDAEGDLLTAIRRVAGTSCLVSTSMDLHGNVSDVLFDASDMLTCYRTAPHEDVWETRERGAYNLVQQILHGSERPAKALVRLPLLLPGEKTSTRVEPARSVYGMIPAIEDQPGVTDASIWVGFAWADEPRSGAAVVVYGDEDGAVARAAKDLAEAFWQRRHDFEFVAPVDTIEACLEYANTAPQPFFISDTGDNPGAGGAGDTTLALSALLAWVSAGDGARTAIFASIVDPHTVEDAFAAGLGKTVELSVGGKIDSRSPGPIDVTATVTALVEDPKGGPTTVLRVGGTLVIVTSRRNQYGQEEQFTRLGLSPRDADVVVVKMGYLEPELYAIQADWKMALTPGGVDQDLSRLPFERISRPIFPLDQDAESYKVQVRLTPKQSGPDDLLAEDGR